MEHHWQGNISQSVLLLQVTFCVFHDTGYTLYFTVLYLYSFLYMRSLQYQVLYLYSFLYEIPAVPSVFTRYNADLDSDPYGESLWYFNYFFYNKRMKRLLFFSCQAQPLVYMKSLFPTRIISPRKKLAVCDVKNLPYMDINWQSIYIYGDFVTSLTAYYSRVDISKRTVALWLYHIRQWLY